MWGCELSYQFHFQMTKNTAEAIRHDNGLQGGDN